MGHLDQFGAALKALRARQEEDGKPLTLQALSRRTGIHYTNLSGYEKEQEWPLRDTLERILDGLGISLLDLAIEVERQQRIARGEEPVLPPPVPGSQEAFEARVRQISSEVFASGLKSIVALPSADLAVIIKHLQASGVEPDLEALAVLDAFLERGRGET